MTDRNAGLDQLSVKTIRMLAVDMVEAANSGHPGLPLGAASMAYVLWTRHLRHNPANPIWPGRDRFILSAGHGSALLYALLHLTGYGLSLDQCRNFRQWGSLTPGHPEFGLTPGVEATTGPLGQGFAMGVGMAIAQAHLAAVHDTQGEPVFDHHTYAIVSDGDLMEGVASEAASLAGTLGLGRLVYLYDDNSISIEGSTDLAFTEDVGGRFAAYGWDVSRVEDGNDLEAIDRAIEAAKQIVDKPSLIMVKTNIGYGSPKQDTSSAHGEPLGGEAMAATRAAFDWPEETFHIPAEVAGHMGQAKEKGAADEAAWTAVLNQRLNGDPDKGRDLKLAVENRLPADWVSAAPVFGPDDGPLATRAASGKVLNALAARLPGMIGGSADLAPSNKTEIAGSTDFVVGGSAAGRNIRFGVRELGMSAIVNGMALHGGLIPYGGTFLIFSDYARPALRLAALMETDSIFVFTHDSIGVGEDGPTHQPVEHLASLRAIPGLTVLRPADANETSAAWQVAVERKGPAILALTRQKLPVIDPAEFPAVADVQSGVGRGAYCLTCTDRTPELILLATGSEVSLALEAQKRLAVQGIVTRLVSMPSWEIFAEQDQDYRDQVLPPAVGARLAIEAGSSMGWDRWVGDEGRIIALDRFGASAPGGELMKQFGFTVENVVARAKELVGR